MLLTCMCVCGHYFVENSLLWPLRPALLGGRTLGGARRHFRGDGSNALASKGQLENGCVVTQRPFVTSQRADIHNCASIKWIMRKTDADTAYCEENSEDFG